MNKILFAGAEVMPFAASGGLGDVLGSLPAALRAADEDVDVRVVMPLYSVIPEQYRKKYEALSKLMDDINYRNGDGTLVIASQMYAVDEGTGKATTFKNSIKHAKRTPCYTTNINDIIKVK